MVDFYNSVEENFRFLETDFGFKLFSNNKQSENTVVYLNETTGIKIVYEYSCTICVIICKLSNGKLLENPRPLKLDSPINCFDLNYLLPENEKMKPAYEYGENSIYYDEKLGLFNYVKDFAVRLKAYGDNVLRGDFSILPEIEKKIKRCE